MWGLLIAELALTFIALCMGSLHYMHMLQLESYQLDGYLRHLKRYKEEWNGWTLATGLACFAAQIVLPIVFTMFTGERTNSAITAHVIIMVACAISVAYNVWRDLSAPKKKPLVFTQRRGKAGRAPPPSFPHPSRRVPGPLVGVFWPFFFHNQGGGG